MSRIEKTVFISYRRTNISWALAIFQNLTQHGYDVFYDFNGIASGDFELVILENINARAHFLVLLTPSALGRCGDPADWLRREIETALKNQRNIVPLMLEGFDYSSPGIANQLTGELVTLKRYNVLRVPPDYFEEAMDRLREKYLNVPLDTVLHPASSSARQTAKAHQAAARSAPKVQDAALSAQKWFEQGFNATDAYEQLRCYSEAIRLDPDFAGAYGNRANVHRTQGDLDGALKDYGEVIRLNSDDALAYYNRGAARRDKGDLDGALEDLSEAIHLNPGLAPAYVGRGIARQDRWFARPFTREAQADFDGALKDFSEAIRLNPDFAPAYYNRGTWRRIQGDLDGALQDYNEAIRLNPDDVLAYRNRASVREIKGDLDGAAQDEEAAGRIEQKTKEIR
jgi:tetratricopeptide (TPR) repeat protein